MTVPRKFEGRMNQRSQPSLPLDGIKVLDLTLARAGPTCVRHLADWGADVVKIEPPATDREEAGGNRHGFDFQNLHRNKRAMSLNLKDPMGHAAFMRPPAGWTRGAGNSAARGGH